MSAFHKIVLAIAGSLNNGTSSPAPQGGNRALRKTDASIAESSLIPKQENGRGFPFFGMPRRIQSALALFASAGIFFGTPNASKAATTIVKDKAKQAAEGWIERNIPSGRAKAEHGGYGIKSYAYRSVHWADNEWLRSDKAYQRRPENPLVVKYMHKSDGPGWFDLDEENHAVMHWDYTYYWYDAGWNSVVDGVKKERRKMIGGEGWQHPNNASYVYYTHRYDYNMKHRVYSNYSESGTNPPSMQENYTVRFHYKLEDITMHHDVSMSRVTREKWEFKDCKNLNAWQDDHEDVDVLEDGEGLVFGLTKGFLEKWWGVCWRGENKDTFEVAGFEIPVDFLGIGVTPCVKKKIGSLERTAAEDVGTVEVEH